MKPIKIFFSILVFSLVFFACRKKDCPSSTPIKTDELSNTTWFGAYGRKYPEYRQLDTLILLDIKPNSFIDVYEKNKAGGLKGKGFYTFDGKNFKATISLFRVGIPYVFEGILNEEKIILSGKIMYDTSNTNGAFEIVHVNPLYYQ